MLLYMRQRDVHIDTKKELDTLEMPKFPLCHKHWIMSISVAFYHNLQVDILFRNFRKKDIRYENTIAIKFNERLIFIGIVKFQAI